MAQGPPFTPSTSKTPNQTTGNTRAGMRTVPANATPVTTPTPQPPVEPVEPATTTSLGVVEISVTPATTAQPIAVGNNDPRVQQATTTQLGIVSLPTTLPAAETVGDTGALGTSNQPARSDHKHPMPGAFTAAGLTSSPGFVPSPGGVHPGGAPFYILGDDASWHPQTDLTELGVVIFGTWQAGTIAPAYLTALGASGGGHSAGIAPDPGSSAGTTRFLCENAQWVVPSGASSLPTDYISGLQISWVSGTSIKVSSGTAYNQGSAQAITYAGGTITGLSTAVNTLYYVYLYLNSGTPTIEVSTTAPTTPYEGTARSKTGDTSRRYLGSILGNSAGTAICQFFTSSGGDSFFYRYGETGNVAPFRVLSAGTATTKTTIACAAVVPVSAQTVIILAVNSGVVSTGNAVVGLSNPSSNSQSMTFVAGLPSFSGSGTLTWTFWALEVYMACDSSQNISYQFNVAPTSGNFGVDLEGYVEAR